MSVGPAPYGALPIGAVPAYVSPAAAASQNVLLLSPRDSDLATMVANTQVGTLPVANLQTAQPQKKWRSTTTTEFITVTFAGPIAANMMALVAHNLSAIAVVRVRGAIVQANLTGAPDLDTGWQSPWPVTGKPIMAAWPNYLSALRWTNTAALQYWRVDIADPAAGQTYIEAGRLVLGVAWQPSTNFDLSGTPLAFDARDVQFTTPYGFTFLDQRAASAPRKFAVVISATNRREVMDGISEIQRLRGLWGDVICCLDPAETTDFHRFSLQGVFTAAPAFGIQPFYDVNGGMWGATLPLLELL